MQLSMELNVEKNSERKFYRYCVDVASGWMYYTPTFALQEVIAGKDLETILKTRVIGLAVHLISVSSIGALRNYMAKKEGVTESSSAWDKIKVDLKAVTPVQASVYAAMLLGGMAWSGNYDWKATAIAFALGVGLGAVHSIPYGKFQDKFRKTFGVEPAIRNSKNYI